MGKTMWFLIKTAFWFSLVLVLLPVFSSQSTSRLQNEPKVQVSDAFGAATGAFQYVSALCSEKPDVCVKGGETFTALGYRAREGALVAYQFLDSQFGGNKADEKSAVSDTIKNGEAAAAKAGQTAMNKVVAAAMQPMPAKPAASSEPADAVVTGTVAAHGSIPIPLAKPTI
jgi:hypothetical protein